MAKFKYKFAQENGKTAQLIFSKVLEEPIMRSIGVMFEIEIMKGTKTYDEKLDEVTIEFVVEDCKKEESLRKAAYSLLRSKNGDINYN